MASLECQEVPILKHLELFLNCLHNWNFHAFFGEEGTLSSLQGLNSLTRDWTRVPFMLSLMVLFPGIPDCSSQKELLPILLVLHSQYESFLAYLFLPSGQRLMLAEQKVIQKVSYCKSKLGNTQNPFLLSPVIKSRRLFLFHLILYFFSTVGICGQVTIPLPPSDNWVMCGKIVMKWLVSYTDLKLSHKLSSFLR